LQAASSVFTSLPGPGSLIGPSNLILHDKWEDIIELNTTKSSSAARSTTLPLRSLQETLHNRIIQKKGEIHESHNRAFNEMIWTEIETLQWVLAQIRCYCDDHQLHKVCFCEPYQIFFDIKEIVIGLMAYR
jgi:hypothetical protein